ncbi:MAG: phosphotransferase [Streptosporangiaceae bacterium]
MHGYVKRRGWPEPGSIPAVLDSFRKELRFYQLIAPEAGIRVPDCYLAEESDAGTLLVLEDLTAWQPGADPAAAARLLAELHLRWQGQAARRWPWLDSAGRADDLVAELFDKTWPTLAARWQLVPIIMAAGERLVGRVREAERAIAGAGPATMIHGDASTLNMRTGPDAEIALLDWEDVSVAPGVYDLAWMLVSSVDADRWDEVIIAYGAADGLAQVLPSAIVQGLLSLSDATPGSAEAAAWQARLAEAWRRVSGDGPR